MPVRAAIRTILLALALIAGVILSPGILAQTAELADPIWADRTYTGARSLMQVQLPEGSTATSLRVDVLLTNTTDASHSVGDFSPSIVVYDRSSRAWPGAGDGGWQFSSTDLAPGGQVILSVTATNPNVLAYAGPVFVRVGGLLETSVVEFVLWFDDGVVSAPTASIVSPLDPSQDPVRPLSSLSAASRPVQNVDAMVPSPQELPAGLVTTAIGKKDAASIAATFTSPGEANALMTQWEWRENAFISMEGAPTADGLVYVDIGFHRFETAEGATLAMAYFADSRADILGEWYMDDPRIGDISTAITNGSDTTIYVLLDRVLVRISVGGSDPTPHALQISRLIATKAQSQGFAIPLHAYREDSV